MAQQHQNPVIQLKLFSLGIKLLRHIQSNRILQVLDFDEAIKINPKDYDIRSQENQRQQIVHKF